MMSTRWARAAAFLTGALLSAAIFTPFLPVWEQKPYTNVELIAVLKENNKVLIDTRFEKTACEFENLIVLGYSLGIPKSYPWISTDGTTGDRIEGEHRLTLLVNIGTDKPEQLQIRTRHICEGAEVVDKTYITVEVPYGEEDLE